MPNCYADVTMLKAALRIPAAQTGDDAALRGVLERVTDGFDEQLRPTHFWSRTATRYLQWRGALGHDRSVLRLDEPLISLSSLTVDEGEDGTYELTLVANTDYVLDPRDALPNEPYRAIRLLPTGTQLSYWPKAADSIKATGTWGWSAETESAGTLGAAISDTTGTSVTMTAGHSVAIGDTIVIDSEQLYVSAVSTNTLTVRRGQNGTTAATHSNAAAVATRRYPAAVEGAALMQAARFWNEQIAGGASALGGSPGGFSFASSYPAIRDLLRGWRPPGFA